MSQVSEEMDIGESEFCLDLYVAFSFEGACKISLL